MLPTTRRLILWFVVVTPIIGYGRSGAAEDFLPQLTALNLPSDQVHPGDVVNARYEFVNLGTAPADGEYMVFVHVRPAITGDPDVGPAAGADFRPLTPTFAWLPQTVVREDGHPASIPKRRSRLAVLPDPQGGNRAGISPRVLYGGQDCGAARATRLRGVRPYLRLRPRPVQRKNRWGGVIGTAAIPVGYAYPCSPSSACTPEVDVRGLRDRTRSLTTCRTDSDQPLAVPTDVPRCAASPRLVARTSRRTSL